MKKSKLTFFFTAFLFLILSFASCSDDNDDNGNDNNNEDIKVEKVEWKEDLKKGIERNLGDNSLNVANRMNIFPNNATNQKQTFSSSNPDIASITPEGQVTPKTLGSTTITVTVDEQTDQFTLTITQKEEVVVDVTSINITTKNIEAKVNSTTNLASLVTVLPEDATNKNVTYKSQDESIVTVDQYGLITALKVGTTKVIVTSEDNTSITGEFNITVTTFYGDYDSRSTWTVENMSPPLFGGEAAAIIEGMFDNNTDTWLSFVKPGQKHSGSGHPAVENPSIEAGGHISFTVDMKSEKVVNYFRIRWRNANDVPMRFAKFQTISGSNDNITFTPIASNVIMTDSDIKANITSPNITIPESTYRYIKFYCGEASCFHSLTTNKTVSIAELYLGRAK